MKGWVLFLRVSELFRPRGATFSSNRVQTQCLRLPAFSSVSVSVVPVPYYLSFM